MYTTRWIPRGTSAPRMWAVLMMVAGAATLVGAPVTAPDAPMTPAVMATAAILAVCGLVAWFVPWTRIGTRFAILLPAICVAVVAAQLAIGPEPAVGIRIGIALLVAGITGETMAWREELRRESELRIHAEHNDELMRSLVQTATDATLVIDVRGAIISASPSATTALGYAVDDLLQSKIDGLVSADDAASILAMHGTVASGSAGRIDCPVLHHDGRWIRAEIAATNLPDDQGLVLTIHDVTRWKELEEQLTRQAFHDPLTGLRTAPCTSTASSTPSAGDASTRRAPPSCSSTSTTSRPSTTPSATSRATTSSARSPGAWPTRSGRRTPPPASAATSSRCSSRTWTRTRRSQRRESGHRRAGPAVRSRRPADAHRRQHRHRPELAGPADRDRHAPRRRHRDVRGEGRRQGPVPRCSSRAMQHATAERLAAERRTCARAVERGEFVAPLPADRRACRGRPSTGVEALVRWAHPDRGLVAAARVHPVGRDGPA